MVHNPQTLTLSPNELARIVGVSESSIRRWVDDGLIRVIRTAGGHRRIPAADAIQFIRQQRMQIFYPEMLGLKDQEVPRGQNHNDLTGEILFSLLKNGQGDQFRSLLIRAYLNGVSPAELLDGPLWQALERIGVLWEHGEQGIFEEHQATTICIEAVSQLRRLIPGPPPGSPVALGGKPSGDPYFLPGLAVATVLAEAGYRSINLGPDTPVAVFHRAIEVSEPQLVWLSMTSDSGKDAIVRFIRQLQEPLEGRGIPVVVGGQAADHYAASLPSTVEHLLTLTDLKTFGTRLITKFQKKNA